MTTTTKKPRTMTYNPVVGTLHINDGGSEKGYYVDRFHDAEGGIGFCLTKIVPPTKPDEPRDYDVLLRDDGTADSCECLGHLRHGHRTVCRHIAAFRCLRERGDL